MHDDTAMVRRDDAPLTLLRSRYQVRLEVTRLRMRSAVARVRRRAHELTPASRIAEDPVRWVLGGLAAGFALAWLTSPRRT